MPYLSPFRCPKVLFGPFRWQKSFSVFSRTAIIHCKKIFFLNCLQDSIERLRPLQIKIDRLKEEKEDVIHQKDEQIETSKAEV